MFVTVGIFHYESKLFPSLVFENRSHRIKRVKLCMSSFLLS